MSRRAVKLINWAAIAELMPESEKAAFLAFRAKSDEFMHRMKSQPEQMPKIDWAYYKKHITIPNLVDNFQKQYEGLSIPYPADKYTSTLAAEEAQLATDIQEFKKKADDYIDEIKAEIAKINATLPEKDMTLEEFFMAHPDLACNADQATAWPHDDPEAQPDHPINFQETEH